jgi:quercetin dioxygenase-like cupin family protein
MITVEYPPGASDPVHRHNAAAFVYLLEGSIVMQVSGGKEVTLTPGQTFVALRPAPASCKCHHRPKCAPVCGQQRVYCY